MHDNALADRAEIKLRRKQSYAFNATAASSAWKSQTSAFGVDYYSYRGRCRRFVLT
jgi:hypothetical protein